MALRVRFALKVNAMPPPVRHAIAASATAMQVQLPYCATRAVVKVALRIACRLATTALAAAAAWPHGGGGDGSGHGPNGEPGGGGGHEGAFWHHQQLWSAQGGSGAQDLEELWGDDGPGEGHRELGGDPEELLEAGGQGEAFWEGGPEDLEEDADDTDSHAARLLRDLWASERVRRLMEEAARAALRRALYHGLLALWRQGQPQQEPRELRGLLLDILLYTLGQVLAAVRLQPDVRRAVAHAMDSPAPAGHLRGARSVLFLQACAVVARELAAALQMALVELNAPSWVREAAGALPGLVPEVVGLLQGNVLGGQLPLAALRV